jgi:F-type H+-transporting ATPase subunit epsilon
MAEAIDLEISTPERQLVHEKVADVQIPGLDGYMGILPGHAPLLGRLGVGFLSYPVGGKRRYLAVHCGFVEVLPDRVRVLADVAERAEEIDVQRARTALDRAHRDLDNPALGVDPAAALAAAQRAQARLEAAQKA